MKIIRQFIPSPKVSQKDYASDSQGQVHRLRVMSFNVLAQGLSSDSFIKCPAEALHFDKRLDGIVEEINSFSADVICLQEVDMFDQLKTRLTDYEGIWREKSDSPCLKFASNIGPDGSAIFYKPGVVKVLSQFSTPIPVDGVESNQVMMAAHLQLATGHQVLLICLHLKAKADYSAIREKQGRSVLEYISAHSDNFHSVIVAGDLNSEPSEPVHKLLEADGFVSSYLDVTGSHPQFTTCKIRSVKGEETTQRKTEDYIYYKNVSSEKHLLVEKVLEMPSEAALGEGRLPNLYYPSDHLSMVTDFIIS